MTASFFFFFSTARRRSSISQVSVAAKGCASAAQPNRDWHSSAYQFNQALQARAATRAGLYCCSPLALGATQRQSGFAVRRTEQALNRQSGRSS